MNRFKNGTLLVVIATIVTAILILMTGRNTSSTLTEEHLVVVENETLQLKIVDLESDEKQGRDDTDVVVNVDQLTNIVIESKLITAPKGPFTKSSVVVEQVTNVEPMIVSSKVMATSNQHELLNHIIQPIWMDQKLGDFKSVENADVTFKMMPTNPDGLQGENPKQVFTSKNDKFAPTTVSANYNYQQMPMYNGGYYIAPMPSYLMPSMLPGTATLNNKTQNHN